MIRPATPADYDRIHEIVTAAFGRDEEAQIVRKARAEGSALYECVAEEDGRVQGHVMFTRMTVDRPLSAAAMGPVAVDPAVQNRGLGGQMILHGIEVCRAMGEDAVIVLGHPTYYPRFGFSADLAKIVASPFGGRPSFMALALSPGALEHPLKADYPPAFG